MRRGLSCWLNVVVFLIASYAQTNSATGRASGARIGLVLEGGGALGLAHIGVLQWLEEHRIPVEYIAGTSMGGLVGGIYATGHSPAEVKAMVRSINWDQVLQGNTPYKDLSYRRKQDAFDYPNNLEFGLRKGIQFPEGFNSGQDVVMILDRISLPYSDVSDFNDLPIAFACVATDLVTSQKFVFRQGSLSVALRSTMSLPGIFSPVRWNGHVFTDGGLMDNLPVDVAKEMGATLTVAVHLETAKLEPDASLSSFGVLGHSVSTVVAASEMLGIERTDILIAVPLQKFGSLDYNKSEELIKLGYEATQQKATVLNAFSVDEATWQIYLARRQAKQRPTPTPQFVEVIGTEPKVTEAIENDLQRDVGKPVDTDALQKQLSEIKGEGRLASLSYQMTEKDGKPGLLVTAAQKPYSPPTVRPLISLDGSNFNGVYFSLGARVTFLDFGTYRTELRNDFVIGSQYGIASQYYRPFSATSRWFIAPNAFANYQLYPIYKQNTFLAEYHKSFIGGGLDLGYNFGRVAQMTLGYTAEYQKFVPKIGNSELLPTVSGRYGATTWGFTLIDVDNPVIPREGQAGTFNTSWLDSNPGASHSFPLAQGRLLKLFRLGPPSSAYFSAGGGTTFGNERIGVPPFSLGANSYFAAYGQNELLTNQYYLFQTGYLRKVLKLPILLGEGVYFNGLFEVGKVFAPPFKSQVPGDVSAAIVINTIFGPLSIGGAVGTAGHQRIFFELGRLFPMPSVR
jgi:NTE family protein